MFPVKCELSNPTKNPDISAGQVAPLNNGGLCPSPSSRFVECYES